MPYDRYGRWWPEHQGARLFGQPDIWGAGPANEEDEFYDITHRALHVYGIPVAPRPYQRGEGAGPVAWPGRARGVPPAHQYHYPYYGYGYTGYGQFGGGYGGRAEHVLYSPRGPYAGVGPRGYVKSDERIREDINEALTEDPWLDPTDVEVTVEDGVVTLSGTVDSWRARRRAAEDAWHVPGVRDVRNVLTVRAKGQGSS